MKTVKFTLSMIVMLAFLGLNDAMGQTWWAKIGTSNNIINTNSGFVLIGNTTPTTLLDVAKNMTEPTITVRNLGGTGGASFRMFDQLNGAEWKFKLTYPNGDFKIRDNKFGRDVFTIEANSPNYFIYIKSFGSMGIGTPTPNNSALVDMTSTTKGFLPPRMTASQRTAIGSPAAGLLVFQTNAPSGYYYYTGTAWTLLAANDNTIQSLDYPQGIDGIFVNFELSLTNLTYTVPAGYNLYLTTFSCYPMVNGIWYATDGSGPLFPENVTLTYINDCGTTGGYTGFLVPVSSAITPVNFMLDDIGTTYTVPNGKKLVLKSGAGQGSGLCINNVQYYNVSRNWLFPPLTVLSNCNYPDGLGYTGYLIDN